ncbi:DUF6193 family natural product biosynthesis protein [Streptomyces olivochromogenes]|uniref:DUF6193 family natural product biosynthesis protein n=1 Tax=Streptomyces olivochromogenes TaxID=1963 RepID=UPI0036830108
MWQWRRERQEVPRPGVGHPGIVHLIDVARAVRALRQLYPYDSHFALRLSSCTRYPYAFSVRAAGAERPAPCPGTTGASGSSWHAAGLSSARRDHGLRKHDHGLRKYSTPTTHSPRVTLPPLFVMPLSKFVRRRGEG